MVALGIIRTDPESMWSLYWLFVPHSGLKMSKICLSKAPFGYVYTPDMHQILPGTVLGVYSTAGHYLCRPRVYIGFIRALCPLLRLENVKKPPRKGPIGGV
jgi:hypothetical protein